MVMKTLYWIFKLLIVALPCFLIFWPVPCLILSKEYATRYIDILFQNQNLNDPSRFAALPFVWAFISLPLSIILLLLGFSLWYAIEVYINRPKQ